MAQENIKYPIDIQSFSKIREEGYAYVDKTEYVYYLTHCVKYAFLNRPRRFGKSLLVSTLKSYFEGRKDLFKGLAIEDLETEWKKYPVLHLDMSRVGIVKGEEALERFLIDELEGYEQQYGLPPYDSTEPVSRFERLIRKVHDIAGRVVVLIDEYDAPLLEVLHEPENYDVARNVMMRFYEVLKSCDAYIKFVFITGITKFSLTTIFGGLNNITNISMFDDFVAICGITEEEMLSQMPEGIERIAKKQGLTNEETLRQVKAMYDGYHFTWPSPDIYNPFSLVNAFSAGELNSYWFGGSMPSYLIDIMKKLCIEARDIQNIRFCIQEIFNAPIENLTNKIPLLYQSGFVTIKDYNEKDDYYILDIPNREIMGCIAV